MRGAFLLQVRWDVMDTWRRREGGGEDGRFFFRFWWTGNVGFCIATGCRIWGTYATERLTSSGAI